jgi:hypothetical protein
MEYKLNPHKKQTKHMQNTNGMHTDVEQTSIEQGTTTEETQNSQRMEGKGHKYQNRLHMETHSKYEQNTEIHKE